MYVLLVEDDTELNRLMRKLLEKEGYACDLANTLERAKEKIKKAVMYDVIILDVVLPDGSGIDLCKELRSEGYDAPILMLTSQSTTVDKVTGLDAGADDYMPKPFSPNELKARLRALLRRPKQQIGEEITCGDVTINTLSHSVKYGNNTIELMPKEYSLLEYLMRKKDQVVRKEEILRHVWGLYSLTSSNKVEVYIRYLRQKIDIPYDTNLIKTVRGAGYKIVDD